MKQYIVHAFTDQVFSGNPAAVCVLDEWISDELMLRITKENRLSETAFIVKEGEYYHLRWFAPGGEVDLCGHATLATSFVVLNYVEPELDEVKFTTLSGILKVKRVGDVYQMDLPSYDLKPIPVTPEMAYATGSFPVRAFMGRDMLLVYKDEETVRDMTPDLDAIAQMDGLLVHVTAPGKEYDCVSRSFGPKLLIDEDPVCGSGHCHIVPYWAKKLEKKDVLAYQASERGGTLYCSDEGPRIRIGGKAVLFASAELNV